jgi:hypothetical protein
MCGRPTTVSLREPSMSTRPSARRSFTSTPFSFSLTTRSSGDTCARRRGRPPPALCAQSPLAARAQRVRTATGYCAMPARRLHEQHVSAAEQPSSLPRRAKDSRLSAMKRRAGRQRALYCAGPSSTIANSGVRGTV